MKDLPIFETPFTFDLQRFSDEGGAGGEGAPGSQEGEPGAGEGNKPEPGEPGAGGQEDPMARFKDKSPEELAQHILNIEGALHESRGTESHLKQQNEFLTGEIQQSQNRPPADKLDEEVPMGDDDFMTFGRFKKEKMQMDQVNLSESIMFSDEIGRARYKDYDEVVKPVIGLMRADKNVENYIIGQPGTRHSMCARAYQMGQSLASEQRRQKDIQSGKQSTLTLLTDAQKIQEGKPKTVGDKTGKKSVSIDKERITQMTQEEWSKLPQETRDKILEEEG